MFLLYVTYHGHDALGQVFKVLSNFRFQRLHVMTKYEALNTVLAFVSSRKHLATTFSVVRTSVESLLKQYEYHCVHARHSDIVVSTGLWH